MQRQEDVPLSAETASGGGWRRKKEHRARGSRLERESCADRKENNFGLRPVFLFLVFEVEDGAVTRTRPLGIRPMRRQGKEEDRMWRTMDEVGEEEGRK